MKVWTKRSTSSVEENDIDCFCVQTNRWSIFRRRSLGKLLCEMIIWPACCPFSSCLQGHYAAGRCLTFSFGFCILSLSLFTEARLETMISFRAHKRARIINRIAQFASCMQLSDDIYRFVEHILIIGREVSEEEGMNEWTNERTDRTDFPLWREASFQWVSVHVIADDVQRSYRTPYAPSSARPIPSLSTSNDSETFSMAPRFHRVVRKTRRDESEISPCIK